VGDMLVLAQEAWVEDMLGHSREPAAARLPAVLPAVSGPARTASLAAWAAEAPLEATAPLAMSAVAKASTSRRPPTSMSGAEATSTLCVPGEISHALSQVAAS